MIRDLCLVLAVVGLLATMIVAGHTESFICDYSFTSGNSLVDALLYGPPLTVILFSVFVFALFRKQMKYRTALISASVILLLVVRALATLKDCY